MGDAQSCGAKFVRLDSATLNDESDEEQLVSEKKNKREREKKVHLIGVVEKNNFIGLDIFFEKKKSELKGFIVIGCVL
ncbi:hypothetical protein BpHYR1_035391 [Brachionus plicatilis]|uniref:Uncharacterized protein n=1 Tax=Brachionus plicatilis TaxID=10195 RepID=A0A3M7SDJ5_BRAPC|nr:hypothetical protein BpHYR1_035391 [Brachionus plicatilis]